MVSVCIATYNGEKFIQEQLQSILMQLHDEDEIIVSDDGSRDETLSIIQAIGDKRIRVIHHESKEEESHFLLDRTTHNFENAICHAKGDYIFLSDQDDVWQRGKVETMVKALQDAELAVHDCQVTDEELNILQPSYFAIIGANTSILRNIHKCTYLGCCMAMRRTILPAILPFPKTKVGHDLWIGLIAKAKYRVTLVREPLILYRKHTHSITTAGKNSQHSLYFKINYRIVTIYQLIKRLL